MGGDHGARTTTLEAQGIWWLWNVVNLNCLVTFFLLQEWVDWKCIKKSHLVMRHAQAWNEALKERQAVYLDPFQEHLNFHVLMWRYTWSDGWWNGFEHGVDSWRVCSKVDHPPKFWTIGIRPVFLFSFLKSNCVWKWGYSKASDGGLPESCSRAAWDSPIP